ncbi:hypothetical protein SBV1_1570026 [Verrucomicrobia bacterium]|nr:hypothetical protein SBV1_1570026 [Verrucomicrobiota bacterium]
MEKPLEPVTPILAAVGAGDHQSAEQLLPLVYNELRRLAAAKMANEPPGQTLQPTALVHEAWLRLVGPNETRWNNRGHFFGAAAEAMRRILVENARRKQRLKHGGGKARIDLSQVDVATASDDDTVVAVSEALDNNKFTPAKILRVRHPRCVCILDAEARPA